MLGYIHGPMSRPAAHNDSPFAWLFDFFFGVQG